MKKLNRILLSYGFVIILALLVIIVSIATKQFFTFSNILGIIHSAIPLITVCCGLALVIIMGKIDLSVGSAAFLSSAVCAVMIARFNISQILAIPAALMIGTIAGTLTGLIVVYLRLNPLIASMGTMFIYRGIALQVVRSRVISLPDNIRNFGNFRIGPIYIDILIGLAILFLVNILHRWTRFGRHVVAIGNSEETARKVGIKTRRMTLLVFVLSGFFASMGGLFSISQLGAVTLHMGSGMEFTAIGALVIGGISLFGGEGRILPGIFLGSITLLLIENALNHLGASPYLYPFVRGGIIFIAMYADSLKQNLQMVFQAETA